MRLSINVKLLLVFSLFVIEKFLILSVYNNINNKYEHFVSELKAEVVEIKLINRIQMALTQMVMLLDDVLITGKKEIEKQNFIDISEEAEGLLSAFDSWVFDQKEEKEAFNRIKEDYLTLKELGFKLFTIPNISESNEAVQIMKNADKIVFDVAIGMRKFHEFANREVAMITINQALAKKMMNAYVLFGALFNIFLVLVVLLYFKKTISEPLINLRNATLEVSKGNFDKKVIVKINDEIGELGTVFNKMTDGLKEAQTHLIQAEKMELISKLARGVAHQVRNPLAVIMQGADYLSACPLAKDEVCSLAINGIADAVKKADNTINGLLEFVSTKKLDVKLLDINFAIEKSLMLVKYQLEKFNITVVSDLKKDIPNILGDKNKIEQAFMNFLSNAIESMPDGGQLKIKTYAEQAAGVIEDPHYKKESSIKFTEQMVVVEIEDSGTGISEDSLNQIFTPFFTTKGDKGGTGLGLWIVRNIIEMHNAKLKIENKKDGKGSKVTVIFKV